MTSGSPVFSWSFPSFLFRRFSVRELICLVDSGCERSFKASEMTMIIISRIIPNAWSAFEAMLPNTQTNQSQVSQRKTLLKESLCKLSGLLSDLQ